MHLCDRYIYITSFVAQLITYPMGVGWAMVMPNRQFKTFGVRWNLNPGPFNMKEHTLITVMANVSFGGGAAYATDTILAQKGFYKHDFGFGFQILLILGTQMIGYGYAGLLRKFLVWPASMLWPQNFVNTSLFYALHDRSPTDPAKTNGWKIGRYNYFLLVFLGSFVWYWFPGRFPIDMLHLEMTTDGCRLDFPSSVLLCVRNLDCTKQCRCQSAVRIPDWTWSYPHHL